MGQTTAHPETSTSAPARLMAPDAPVAPARPGREPVPAPAIKAGTSSTRAVVGAVLVVVAAAASVGWYVKYDKYETTDDARIEGEIVAVPARIAGIVKKSRVKDNQFVHQGEVLTDLDPSPPAARLALAEAELAAARALAEVANAQVAIVEARSRGQRSAAEATVREATVELSTRPDEVAQAAAQVSAAQATYRKADTDLERAKAIFAERLISPQQLDVAQNAADAAVANLAEAQARLRITAASTDAAHARVTEAEGRLRESGAVDAQIAEARAKAAAARAGVQAAEAARNLAALELSYTEIVAPISGIASNRSFTAGQMVTVGQPLVMIVPTEDVWVIANFKETQLERMRVGQPVRIHVDSYPGLDVSGNIESLSGATGAHFSLLPPDNATGNFVKVVQRVPVRIRLQPWAKDKVLRPGMSVVATVAVGDQSSTVGASTSR